jgi:hypothetical protein
MVESISSHGSDMAKECLSLTIYKVVLKVSKKVESRSSHSSEMAKEWLSLTIYKVVLKVSKKVESSSTVVPIQTWPRNGCP